MKRNLLFSQTTALGKTLGKRLAMVLTMLLIVGIGQVWGAEEAVTISFANANQRVSQTTSKQVWENGDVTFTNDKGASTSDVVNNTNPVRLYASSSITITAPGNITKIVATASSSNYATALKNSITSGATISGSVVTIIPSTSSTTYKIAKLSAQVRLSSIAITYEVAASCDKKVTIDKGTPSNGDFELSESGAQETCDGLTIVVTPTPHEHYVVNQVTATTPTTGGAPTIKDNGDDTWSVTYAANSTGSSIINVTFEEAPRATITLSEAGVETPVTGKYVGDSYTLPSTTSQSCGDLEFVGWSTVEINNSASKPASNYYAKGASVTLAANQTFYAVFAEEGGNDEETVLVNFTGGTKSDLTNLTGISAIGLGTDYAENNAPYRVKLDNTGDYILYTNESNQYISQIYLKVKMIGGANTSTITLKTSDDNINFTTITNHNISGDQNNVKELSIEANTSAKYIQLYYTKGSNVGLGLLVIYAKSLSYQNYTTQCTAKPTVFVIPKCGGMVAARG
jgi:hypothetical protein